MQVMLQVIRVAMLPSLDYTLSNAALINIDQSWVAIDIIIELICDDL